jgi:hypothetical protein
MQPTKQGFETVIALTGSTASLRADVALHSPSRRVIAGNDRTTFPPDVGRMSALTPKRTRKCLRCRKADVALNRYRSSMLSGLPAQA